MHNIQKLKDFINRASQTFLCSAIGGRRTGGEAAERDGDEHSGGVDEAVKIWISVNAARTELEVAV